MSDATPTEEGGRSLSLGGRMEAACDRVEAAWKAGRRPRIEDHLGDDSDPARSDLLRELLALELAYRDRAGERPMPQDYRDRFPEHAALIEAVFGGSTASGDIGDGPATFPQGRADDRGHLGGPDPTAVVGPRYLIRKSHARGGLGEVFEADDRELRRVVALKKLQASHADSPASRARFVREAEITGRLEHPGIVPVYGLGRDPDGRPYYAMRFIEGQTLKEAIDDYHRADADPKADRTGRSLALRKLLTRFVAVCQAVHYAHSRGVIHRDLKPSNIMLGPHGETLIVDWGLARPTDRPNDKSGGPAPQPSWSPSGSDSTLTETGVGMGTLQYMSPEQAEGRWDRVGTASDVYSLGATLYHLLCGRAPFTDSDRWEVQQKVVRGDFPAPRQVLRSIERPLEAICLKAMALEPGDRYATARLLADDIELWLADEPVSAHRQSPAERASRWMRWHRTTATSTALMALVGVTVWLIVQGKANRDLSATNRALTDAYARESQAKDRERSRFDLAMSAIKTFYTGVSKDFLLKQRAFKELRLKLLRGASEFYRKLEVELEHQTDEPSRTALADAYSDLADLTNMVGSKEDALAIRQKARAIRQKLADDNPESTQLQADLARAYVNLGDLQAATNAQDAHPSYERARAIFQRLADDNPDSTQVQRDLSLTLNNIGLYQKATDHPREARQSLEQARAIRQKLADDNPDSTQFQADLASTLGNIGNLQNEDAGPSVALQTFEKVRAIFQKLTEAHPTDAHLQADLGGAYLSIGYMQQRRRRPEEAIRANEKARAIFQRLADDSPANTVFQFWVASIDHNIGTLQKETHRSGEALQSFDRARAIFQKLALSDPTFTDYEARLGNSTGCLARIDIDEGRLGMAHARLVEAIQHVEVALKGNPLHPEYRRFLRDHRLNLARANVLMRRPSEAARIVRKVVSLTDGSPESLYDSACSIALLVPLASDRSEASYYAEEAVTVLKQAVAAGWTKAMHTATDPDLAPLHDHEEFRRLLARMFDRGFPADPFARDN